MPSFTVAQIAVLIGGEVAGDGAGVVCGVEEIESAGPDQITFIRDARHASAWTDSKARAALVSRGVELAPGPGRALVRVPDADLAVAATLELFAPPPVRPAAGIHFRATVEPGAELGPGVAVGAGCYVGHGVRLGAGTVLHPQVVILDHTTLGEGCELYPGVVVRERCTLGHRVMLHPNVVIGADGFGYRPSPDGSSLVKLPHIGTVCLEDDVELGAGTCVDRGKFSATRIGTGTKIDNLCQIAHNCRIGRHCVLAGQVGLAGSVVVGDGVQIGGKAAVREHVRIGAGARIAALAAVMNDVPAGAVWAGYPAREAGEALREAAAARKLPELIKLLRKKE